MLDLSDVYLTIFVPARVAGSLTIGDEARVTLDPDPAAVFPAKVTFVATKAQFTPKTVETAEEREKLMFRVKLSAPPDLLTRLSTGSRRACAVSDTCAPNRIRPGLTNSL